MERCPPPRSTTRPMARSRATPPMRCSGRRSPICRPRCRHPRVRRTPEVEAPVRNTGLCAVGLLTSVLLALGSSAGLEAHDMWIEPTSFSVDLGRVLGVKLRVGDDFHG